MSFVNVTENPEDAPREDEDQEETACPEAVAAGREASSITHALFSASEIAEEEAAIEAQCAAQAAAEGWDGISHWNAPYPYEVKEEKKEQKVTSAAAAAAAADDDDDDDNNDRQIDDLMQQVDADDARRLDADQQAANDDEKQLADFLAEMRNMAPTGSLLSSMQKQADAIASLNYRQCIEDTDLVSQLLGDLSDFTLPSSQVVDDLLRRVLGRCGSKYEKAFVLAEPYSVCSLQIEALALMFYCGVCKATVNEQKQHQSLSKRAIPGMKELETVEASLLARFRQHLFPADFQKNLLGKREAFTDLIAKYGLVLHRRATLMVEKQETTNDNTSLVYVNDALVNAAAHFFYWQAMMLHIYDKWPITSIHLSISRACETQEEERAEAAATTPKEKDQLSLKRTSQLVQTFASILHDLLGCQLALSEQGVQVEARQNIMSWMMPIHAYAEYAEKKGEFAQGSVSDVAREVIKNDICKYNEYQSLPYLRAEDREQMPLMVREAWYISTWSMWVRQNSAVDKYDFTTNCILWQDWTEPNKCIAKLDDEGASRQIKRRPILVHLGHGCWYVHWNARLHTLPGVQPTLCTALAIWYLIVIEAFASEPFDSLGKLPGMAALQKAVKSLKETVAEKVKAMEVADRAKKTYTQVQTKTSDDQKAPAYDEGRQL